MESLRREMEALLLRALFRVYIALCLQPPRRLSLPTHQLARSLCARCQRGGQRVKPFLQRERGGEGSGEKIIYSCGNQRHGDWSSNGK